MVDNVVHQTISRLRRALHESARAPSVIEHVPRRGYRLIVMPCVVESGHGRGRLELLRDDEPDVQPFDDQLGTEFASISWITSIWSFDPGWEH